MKNREKISKQNNFDQKNWEKVSTVQKMCILVDK